MMIFLVLPGQSALAKGWCLGLSGGGGLPTGAFGDYWKPGLLVSASIDYIPKSRLALGIGGFALQSEPSKSYADNLALVSGDAELKTLHYGLHVRYMAAGGAPVGLHLVGGAGFYDLKSRYEDPSLVQELKDKAFGLRWGLGIDHKLNRIWRASLEGNYHHVFSDEGKFGYRSAPFISLTAGVAWCLPVHPEE